MIFAILQKMKVKQNAVEYFKSMKTEKLVETILGAFQQLDEDLKKKKLGKGK